MCSSALMIPLNPMLLCTLNLLFVILRTVIGYILGLLLKQRK